MDTNSIFSVQICEKECREIHEYASSRRLNDLIPALVGRNRYERKQIRETYLVMYGEDLIDHLQMTQSNHTNQKYSLLSLWMLEPYERDAVIARNAFEDSDINYKALIEIYTGRKSSQILLVNQAYQHKYKRQLDQDIISFEMSHPYQRILVALATSHRSHNVDVSQHIAKCDVKRLYETGEGKGGSGGGGIEESVVLEMFSKRSIPQLRQTFSTYKHIYGHEYSKSLKKDIYGDFEDALGIVVKCIYTPAIYYAKILHSCIKGTTADKGALARVIVSRAEIDMDEIQRVFKNKYEIELKDAILCENTMILDKPQRDFIVALSNIRYPS
ncbi:hypothetical protein MKX01_034627 [Papaver californicum]|nr:hypothetical protein MKX01_034627 [Papaver californicum]